MKMITLSVLLIFLSLNSSAQQKSLENLLSQSACKYLEKIKLDTVATQQQKKNALSMIFAQATREHEQLLKKDVRFNSLNTYDQGKKVGLWISQFVVPIMVVDCPKFILLMNK